MAAKCSVYACYEPVKARHLCERHYRLWAEGRLDEAADAGAGQLRDGDEGGVCLCAKPEPDAVGQCVCGRLVVTYAHGEANRRKYRALYPDQWARARRLRLGPR